MQKTTEKYFKNFILGSKLTPAGTARVKLVQSLKIDIKDTFVDR